MQLPACIVNVFLWYDADDRASSKNVTHKCLCARMACSDARGINVWGHTHVTQTLPLTCLGLFNKVDLWLYLPDCVDIWCIKSMQYRYALDNELFSPL